MIRPLLAIPLPLMLLAACSGGSTPATDNAATANTAAPDGGYAARVAALSPRLRQGVFLRAIRDGGEQCQEVTAEQSVDPIEGKPAWAVTCDRTARWVITIDRAGTAIVQKI